MTKKIFVIDDEDIIINLFKELLLRAGYDVMCLTDPVMALNKIIEFKPDLMILDLSMPQKDGYELIEDIRMTPSLVKTPIIVVTARNDESSLKKIDSIKVQSYFIKPIIAGDVLSKLAQLLQ